MTPSLWRGRAARPLVFAVIAQSCLLGTGFSNSGSIPWAAAAAKQEPESTAAAASDRFLAVKSWTGTFTMTTPLQQGKGETDNRGSTSTWQLESSSHGTVLIDQLVSTTGTAYRWEGSAKGTLTVNHSNRRVKASMANTPPCNLTWTIHHDTLPFSTDGHGDPLRSRLELRRRENSYDFDFRQGSTLVEHRDAGVCTGTRVDTTSRKAESFYFSARKIPLPASGLTLSGSQKLKVTKSGLWPLMYTGRQNSVRDYDVEITWNLQPVLDDIELVVDSEAYDSWQPEAGPDESTIGNEITIDARLQRPDGSTTNIKARKIIFELTDTSREPGIALNFPLAAATPGDFDLQFSPKSNPPGRYKISGTGNQRAETVPGQYTSASAVVSSFDWGGWGTLKVTAELEDGRHVPGHFKNKSGPADILLPKRAKDSKIADFWKQQAGASLPDDDDSETGPAGDGSPGDGFSLYEEYRGFYVNGEHLPGDPKKIDFFVRNYIKDDAEPGISLFADLTGAKVHSKLLDTEFDLQDRVMNANRDKGPHCDPRGAGSFEQTQGQHGVFLVTQAELDGGLTVLSQAGVRGRPVITKGINLQPRNSLTGMSTSENVPLSDLAFAYDRAVAHELLHSVGAEHHGEGDGTATFYFHFGDDPRNKTGKPHFTSEWIEEGVGFREADHMSIIDEASGRDLASLMEGDMMLLRESFRPSQYPLSLKFWKQQPNSSGRWTAEQYAEHALIVYATHTGIPLYVGAEHGACSGNELCLMRYYFAKIYPKRGTENAFYYISDRRTERIGKELCRSPEGTGINDKGRKPQPRYGDAASTRGACASSIIFNDALPLVSDAIPEQKKPKQ